MTEAGVGASALPDELWVAVLGFLDAPALVALRRTSAFFRGIALDARYERLIHVHRREVAYLRSRRRALDRFHGPHFQPKRRPVMPPDLRPVFSPVTVAAPLIIGERDAWKRA